MTYVVTENCILCKYTDCVEVCPVDCFRGGENMVVIHPDECIDCGVCEPVCPTKAIVTDNDPMAGPWLAINARFAGTWPVLAEKIEPPMDAAQWDGKPGKLTRLSTAPHAGGLQP